MAAAAKSSGGGGGGGGGLEAVGYYDRWGNFVEYEKPPENKHTKTGVLLRNDIPDPDEPEDRALFLSEWKEQRLASISDGLQASKCAWPQYDRIVQLKRFDLFQAEGPVVHCGTSDLAASRRLRPLPLWLPVRTIFFIDQKEPFTKKIIVESTGPPRRDKYYLEGKKNPRDLTTWLPKEELWGYQGSERIPGVQDVFIDFQDTPDRYFFSTEVDPPLGRRRQARFAAYPVTQYFIVQSTVRHESLDAEGGKGVTQLILKGPLCFGKKHWRLVGSFFGFDQPLPSTNKYTIYTRQDPFPRMQISIGPFDRPEEWDPPLVFYAWDVPIPGTVMYQLQHCIRSIHSTAACLPRHKLTMDDLKMPWEFRMNIYVFPAALEDCRIIDKPVDQMPKLSL